MTDKFILNDKREVVPCDDLITWGKWFQDNQEKRRVGQDQIGDSKVSTVFLGLDHAYGGGPPVLWETMVFGGPLDQEMDRCAGTWADAVQMHNKMVTRVQTATAESEPKTEEEDEDDDQGASVLGLGAGALASELLSTPDEPNSSTPDPEPSPFESGGGEFGGGGSSGDFGSSDAGSSDTSSSDSGSSDYGSSDAGGSDAGGGSDC